MASVEFVDFGTVLSSLEQRFLVDLKDLLLGQDRLGDLVEAGTLRTAAVSSHSTVDRQLLPAGKLLLKIIIVHEAHESVHFEV